MSSSFAFEVALPAADARFLLRLLQGVISEDDLVNELMQSDTRIHAAADKAAKEYRRSHRNSSSSAAAALPSPPPAVQAQLRGHNHLSR